MGYFLLRWISLVTLLSFGAIGLVFQIAAPVPIGLESFLQSCTTAITACWLGITPGHTTPPLAVDMLVDHGYQLSHGIAARESMMGYESRTGAEPCRIELYWSGNRVTQMGIYFCGGIRLGDVQSLFPFDDRVRVRLIAQGGTVESSRPAYQIPFKGRLSPQALVYSIWLHPLTRLRQEITFPWFGYTPAWRYCQLHPATSCP